MPLTLVLLAACSKDGGGATDKKPPIAWRAAAVADVTGDGADDLIVTADGRVGAYSTAKKALVWQLKRSKVVDVDATEGRVYLALNGSSVEALRGKDGNSLWKAKRVPVARVDTVEPGLVLATDYQGQMVLRAADGAPVTPAGDREHSLVASTSELVIVSNPKDKELRSYRVKDSALAWKTAIPGKPPRHFQIRNGKLSIESRNKAAPFWFEQLALEDGSVAAKKKASPKGNWVGRSESGALYLFDGLNVALEGTMTKLDASLKKAWSVDVAKAKWPIHDLIPRFNDPTKPVAGTSLMYGLLHQGADNSRLVIFDDKNGTVRGHRDLGFSQHLVDSVKDKLLVLSRGSKPALVAVDASSLKDAWSFPLPRQAETAVFVHNQTVYAVAAVESAVSIWRLDDSGKATWNTSIEGAAMDHDPHGLGIRGGILGSSTLVVENAPGQLIALDLARGHLAKVAP